MVIDGTEYVRVITPDNEVWDKLLWLTHRGIKKDDVVYYLEGNGTHWLFKSTRARIAMEFKLTWA
jgi:hypothetical protein